MCDFSQYGGVSKEWLVVEAALPPEAPGQSAVEMRAAANAAREKASAEELAALAGDVELIDVDIPARDGATLEGRLYWPAAVPKTPEVRPALFLYLHGGGYLFGTLASEDATCAATALHLAAEAAVVVLNLNYRHTPEHTYPTAWHDAQDALAWIHHDAVPRFHIDPARIVVGGISAGAHIVASLVMEQHLGRLPGPRLPPIAGQVLMIPCVVNIDCQAPQLAKMASAEVSSLVENADAPLLPLSIVRFFTDLLINGDPPDPDDTMLSPGNAQPEQVRGLPPTVFGITGLDPLRDEALLYAKMLTEEGVPTDIQLFRGVPHGYRRYYNNRPMAKAWDDVLEQGILWALSKPKATGRFDVKVHGDLA